MIINIGHITINVILEPEDTEVVVQEAPVKRGHRTPEEIQARLEFAESRQLVLQKRAECLQRRMRIAERLRDLFGNETANSILGSVA